MKNDPHSVGHKVLDVILLEDSISVGAMMAETLTQKGCVVHWYKNGKSLLDDLKDKVLFYDFAILDCSLPDIDGVTVAKELHKERPMAGVVLCSGYEMKRIQGVDYFISKTHFHERIDDIIKEYRRRL